MRNSNLCLGCHTYFEEGEKVPLENMFIQFKNYYLPVKDSKQRWILLKTLVGFLNSKGGTIYIGIEDNEGQVLGQEIKRKQRDEFLLFIKTLADKIIPPVDFFNKQEISIVYVPVVSNKIFKGKYVIKIIVKQGEPSKTYHFSQEIQLEFKGKSEKYQISHAFYRHNMGGIVEIRGEALLEEIARKAANPNQIVSTFHKFCNPKPLKLDGPLTKIGFSGIRKEELRNKLQQIFHNNLQSFDVEYQLTYDIENQVLLIELQNQEQYQKINKYVKNNLNELNQGKLFNFVEKGEYLDFYLYKNIGNKRGLSSKGSDIDEKEPSFQKGYIQKQACSPTERPQKQQQQPQLEQTKKIQKAAEQFKQFLDLPDKVAPNKSRQKDLSFQKSKSESKWSKIIDDQQKPKKSRYVESNKSKQECFKKQFVVTITHLIPEKRDELEEILKQLNQHNFKIEFQRYNSTLELKFQSREGVVKYHELLLKNSQKLSSFGVQSNLVIGVNTKKIMLRGYNSKSRKELKLYIKNKVKQDCDQIQFKKSNNKYFLEVTFKTRQLTCQWLDQLLSDINLDQFSFPGPDNLNDKLRIYIYCECN